MQRYAVRLTGNYGTFEVTKVVGVWAEDEDTAKEEAYLLTGISPDVATGGWEMTSPEGEEWEIEIVSTWPPLPEEGVTRCHCGAKYWDDGRCASCGAQWDGTDATVAVS